METTVRHEPGDRVVVDKRTHGRWWFDACCRKHPKTERDWLARLALWNQSVAEWGGANATN